MSIRPLTAAAAGTLLGLTALVLSAAPTAYAAPQTAQGGRAAKGAQAPTGPAHHGPVTVAHRGASAYAPENTLAAVDKAAELGIEWVENDVQRTKDGKLVVLHDTTLNRTTDVEERFPDRGPWNVSDFTLKEIRSLDAGSWFSKDFKGAKVPTFDEYMRKITRNGQRLLLELKSPDLYPGIERQTLTSLRHDGWLDRRHVKSKLIVQSFDGESIKKVHKLRSDVKTGFLGNPAVNELSEYAKFADQINPTYAKATKDYVDAIHKVRGPHHRPLEVYTWTVNDADTARKVTEAGVDGIISNKPDVVRDATLQVAASD